jgi:amino acid permease
LAMQVLSVLFNVVFWVMFVITFFLMMNQLMYQEHSIAHEWYKKAIGFHVVVFTVIAWLVMSSLGCVLMHKYGTAAAMFCVALIWLFFFIMYNRIIEMDVENKITAGDFPPSEAEMLKNISDHSRDNLIDNPTA